jgi:hypothetical protein
MDFIIYISHQKANDYQMFLPAYPSGINPEKMFSGTAEPGGRETPFTKYSHNRPAISIHLLLEIAVTCGLILAIGIPRLLALDSFVTTDERLWLERSGRFYYALAHHDFAATFQKSHPGVTVMWAGLTGYMAVYPRYRESQAGQNRPLLST